MKRRLLVLGSLVAILLGAAVPAAQAATTQTKSCTSSGTAWQVQAVWGSVYTDAKGVKRTPLTVRWTAPKASQLTYFEVRSSGVLTKPDERVDYANGRSWKTVDAPDPGLRTSVRVTLGIPYDGLPNCSVTFAAPSTPAPSTPAPATPAPATPAPATPAPAKPAPVTPKSKILFQDDFNGAAGSLPDQSKWRDFSTCTSPPMGFGQIKCGDNERLTGSGQLAIPATPTAGSGLTTAGKFSFTYGTASAWIKTPKTTGYWPAFWTENRPADFHSVPLFAEVDILELYTWEPQYAHTGGMHAWAPDRQLWGGTDNYCTKPGVKDYGDAFHKYSVTFEPDRITGYVDDVQCGPVVLKSSDPAKPWPFAPDVKLANYLILNLAIGGAGGRQPTPPKADVMLVDRVEVRSLTK